MKLIRFNRQNKYGNKGKFYNGRMYDSTFEANYAETLDWRKKAGEIQEIVPQFKLELRVDDDHIANYYVDFKVVLSDGTVEFHEVKGFETAEWKIKWRLAQSIYGKEKFVLIK